jgi:Kdo2-lipid IVA lauroyltransferase/acyltransferase
VAQKVPFIKKCRWYLEAVLFLTISYLVARLPYKAAQATGKGLGRLLFRLLKRRREIAIKNISASLPFLERQPGWVPRGAVELARETFENLGRSAVEVCKLYHNTADALIASVEYRGLEHFHKAKEKGRGVALLTGHCGNWELIALSFASRVHPMSVVAKRQDNQYLNRVLEKIRRRHGNSLIYADGALRNMLSQFRKNGVVGLLVDQATWTRNGVLVDFLGRPAWTTNMLALLARRNQVPILPAFVHREGERQVVEIHPELDLGEAQADSEVQDTVRVTRCLEDYVVKHPTEWYWIHQRWKRAPQPAEQADK